MSITLMSEVWYLDLPATDKLVLLALADAANDEGDGHTWIAIKSRNEVSPRSGRPTLDLVKKTGLTEKCIQNVIGRLEARGLLIAEKRPGKSSNYFVLPAPGADGTVDQATDKQRTTFATAESSSEPRSPSSEPRSPKQRTPRHYNHKNPQEPARARDARGGLGKTPAPAARSTRADAPVPERSLEAHRELAVRQALERAHGGQEPFWLARVGIKCGDISDDGQVVGLTLFVPIGHKDCVEQLTGRVQAVADRDTTLTVRWVKVEHTRAKQAA